MHSAFELMNVYGSKNIPFLFIIDFEFQDVRVYIPDEIDTNVLLFDIEGFGNFEKKKAGKEIFFRIVKDVGFKHYQKAFDYVQENLKKGNTYLLNLTFPTEIECNLDLQEIFYVCKSKYRLWLKDNFVCFSPETFVKINDGKIFSCPMKGTIDATLPDAKNLLLNSEKEKAEHYTIVDLIRNDLSIVAKNVRVERFRYVEEIKTNQKNLFQVSSLISGVLPRNYTEKIGDIIFALLPAGSVTGAPKKKTVEIIKSAEQYHRGFYTGIFGYFDGKNVNSAVMIRFIEQQDNGKLLYKSGGGITLDSNAEEEYRELLEKVYLPVY